MKSTTIKDPLCKSRQREISLKNSCAKNVSPIVVSNSIVSIGKLFYHHGSSPDNVNDTLRQLKKDGFDEIEGFTVTNNDAGPLLRNGSGRNARDLAKNYQRRNRRQK